jgi:GDPmannose 4,6-dehydratase
MRKKAFITGITGQDGSYLAELLLEKNYEVHGLVRRSSSPNFDRIKHILPQLTLHEGDLSDATSLKRIVERTHPHEIYNLGAMSHVRTSFDVPEYTADVDGVGVLRLLNIIRNFDPKIRFYQASTSELFGKVQQVPQTELTPFYPRSPYAIAKLYAYWTVVNFREGYGLYACNGILFNHESPRRGETFVPRKITLAATRIAHGLQEKLVLGNLDAKRDWGYAKDFVEGMWMMLQQPKPEDYVLATGTTTTVRAFVESTFREVGLPIEWRGAGLSEKGVHNGRVLIEISPEFFRPAEVDLLIGNAAKAKKQLGWEPRTSLDELMRMMVQSDLKLIAASDKVLA